MSSSSKLSESNVEIPYSSSQTSPTLISSGKCPPPETRLEVETKPLTSLVDFTVNGSLPFRFPQASPAPGALAVIGSCRALVGLISEINLMSASEDYLNSTRTAVL